MGSFGWQEGPRAGPGALWQQRPRCGLAGGQVRFGHVEHSDGSSRRRSERP